MRWTTAVGLVYSVAPPGIGPPHPPDPDYEPPELRRRCTHPPTVHAHPHMAPIDDEPPF
jgi:hypothetical protein